MSGWLPLLAVLVVHPSAAHPDTIRDRVIVAPAETLSVTVRGSGPTVVIVPGLLGGVFGFRHVTEELEAAGRRVVIVEPLGTGGSSRPEEADYSYTAQAERIAAALDTLDVSRAVFVVHAVGAPVGYRLAILRPDLVDALVSINGGPAEQLNTPGVNTVLRFAPILKIFGAEGRARSKLTDGLRNASYDPDWVTTDVIEAYGTDYKKDLWGTLRMLQRMSRSEDPWLLQPALSEIAAPVILLRSAELPQSIPDAEVELLAARIPEFRVDSIARSGQYVHEERPDAVVATLLELTSGQR